MTAPGFPLYPDPMVTLKEWQARLNTYLGLLDVRIEDIESFKDDWEPKYTASSGTYTADEEFFKFYLRYGDVCAFVLGVDGTTSAGPDRINITAPFTPAFTNMPVWGRTINGSGDEPLKGGVILDSNGEGQIFARRGAGAGNWSAGSGRQIYVGGIYKVADDAVLL